MKLNVTKSRYSVFWAVILCYLLPVVGLSAYAAAIGKSTNGLQLMACGLLIAAAGSIAMFWVLLRWQAAKHTSKISMKPVSMPIAASLRQEVAEETFPFSQDSFEEKAELESQLQEMHETTHQLHQKLEDTFKKAQDEKHLLDMEKERFRQQAEQALTEMDAFKQASYQQLAQQKNMISELQEIIADNKMALEKKQQQIGQLETKVSDMRYEIRTLLHLAESHQEPEYEHPIQPDSDYPSNVPLPGDEYAFDDDTVVATPEKQICTYAGASLQLRRCLDIAQKITGSNRFNGPLSTFLDSPSDSFTIDLRRLCDSLRSENNSCILFYSPKESQLLFANNQVKALTGWSPDKFVENFFEILQASATEWRQGLSSLSMRSEAQVKLKLKARNGQEIPVHGHLGLIATGIFRHHAIAVLYPQLI